MSATIKVENVYKNGKNKLHYQFFISNDLFVITQEWLKHHI